ncbi:MAG: helix-turn-helix domain-containing protein [Gemmatimonadaceae bacterium]
MRDVAERSGLSKRAVQQALSRLVRRGLISMRRDGITAVAVYSVLRPWRR